MNRKGITLVAHADWSVNPKKRWCSCAIQEGEGQYRAYDPVQVVHPSSLLQQLEEAAGPTGCVLVGFDFPIGLPYSYAEKAGIADFLVWLFLLGKGKWNEFFDVAETPEQISLYRPFYPKRPGRTTRGDLVLRLGIDSFSDLLRECERAYPGRRAACPLFWTLGGQQVGKAALSGWRHVLVPALLSGSDPELNAVASRSISIWPFSGALDRLLQHGSTVIVETYPAEFYTRLGVEFSPRRQGRRSGKRDRSDRAAQAGSLLSWAAKNFVTLEAGLEKSIKHGFGPSADAEDRFDAVVGLFGMLDVLSQNDRFEPQRGRILAVEGWIFGQDQHDKSPT